MLGEIYADTPVSSYQPGKEISDFTNYVKKDYAAGSEILSRAWTELNDYSVIERMNKDQRTFNAFVDESIDDPAEAWKWRGTRSKARNRAIQMHAQITASYIVPMFMAQNEDSEEDKAFSEFMRDIVEWMTETSNYKPAFLMTAMGMLVNPVTYLGADYAEVYQTIKERTADGYATKEILDEVLSGFQATVYSADQILISNAYDQNVQRHRFNMKKRYIEYSEAQAKYGDHPNFEHVKKGFVAVWDESAGLFYDVKDQDHPFLVEEVTPSYRRDDTEVCFLGGVYLGNENVEMNPMRHRDNRGAPKYNVVPFGYQRINEHFFFYKSLMNGMFWDNQLLDAQYEMGMNRAFLDTNMPIAVTGEESIDGDIIFPGSITAFKKSDTKVSAVLPPANLGNMFAAISQVESSMDEASVSDTTGGQLPPASTKATAIAVAQQNAKTMLQGVGKTLGESMVQYGGLMSDIAITHLSVPEVMEIVGDHTKLKYKTFILGNKMVSGKSVSKVLRFKESMLGMSMSKDQIDQEHLKLLEETGYPDHTKHIYDINPERFAQMKYLTKVEPAQMFPKNEEFQQAMWQQLYTLLAQDPTINHETLVHELMYAFVQGRADDFVSKQPSANPMDPTAIPTMQGTQGAPKKPAPTAGPIASGKALSTGLRGTGVAA